MKIIVDDFGMNAQNDNEILNLLILKTDIFYGVSCSMIDADSDSQKIRFQNLAKLSSLKLGLHITLTNFYSLHDRNFKMPTFTKLLHLCLCSKTQFEWVEKEIELQIYKFIEIFSFFPLFIDGHQHVQQLPIIRGILIRAFQKFSNSSDIFFIRNSSLGLKTSLASISLGVSTLLKNLALSLIGVTFRRYLHKRKIPTNYNLLGSYSKFGTASYSAVFKFYLNQSVSKHDILYCHPGVETQLLFGIEPGQPRRAEECHYFLGLKLDEKNL